MFKRALLLFVIATFPAMADELPACLPSIFGHCGEAAKDRLRETPKPAHKRKSCDRHDEAKAAARAEAKADKAEAKAAAKEAKIDERQAARKAERKAEREHQRSDEREAHHQSKGHHR
jgi:hypothetical protein